MTQDILIALGIWLAVALVLAPIIGAFIAVGSGEHDRRRR